MFPHYRKSEATCSSATSLIRVLHVVDCVVVRSGFLSVIESYHRHLDPNEVRFDFLYFFEYPESCRGQLEEKGSRVFYVPFQESKRPFKTIDDFFAEHKDEWDVLHCHPPFAPQVFGRAAKRHGVKRIVSHSHSTKFSDKPLSAARNWLLARFLGLFATDYVTCSDAARVLLGKHGKNAFLLRNAIECDRFKFDPVARASARAELGMPEGTLLLGGVGRLAAQKNQHFMLVLLRGIKERGVPCKLAIAGSGPKEAFLRERALELGVGDDLMLLGERSDTSRLYSAFDVFLLPSLFEGLPISLIEAQTSGLPCLASDAITTEARIVNAEFLPIDADPAVWVDAALSAWVRGTDREAACHAVKLAGFDVPSEAERLVGFYRSILEGADVA